MLGWRFPYSTAHRHETTFRQAESAIGARVTKCYADRALPSRSVEKYGSIGKAIALIWSSHSFCDLRGWTAIEEPDRAGYSLLYRPRPAVLFFRGSGSRSVAVRQA